MKRILYLTFYFEPDLCAGSFRNSPLARELAKQLKGKAEIDLYTTMPNRYASFQQEAILYEEEDNLRISRIALPAHKSGMADQAKSFVAYYREVLSRTRNNHYDLVFASSSRLFTAYLGKKIARRNRAPLYLDIRDIFYDSMKDLLSGNLLRRIILPVVHAVEKKTFRSGTHINLISPGFESYFTKFPHANYSFFTNGIDDEFLALESTPIQSDKVKKRVLYAGNIGEGQGLHKFVPGLAKQFSSELEFLIIGDGGALGKLKEAVAAEGCTNVSFEKPLKRAELLAAYDLADYFLIHLNDYDAFKKVLPSKIFELGATDKPIIAGVGGYAARFIRENLDNVILVDPCDVESCVAAMRQYSYQRSPRHEFIKKFSRRSVNEHMAASIAGYLNLTFPE